MAGNINGYPTSLNVTINGYKYDESLLDSQLNKNENAISPIIAG